MSAEPHLLPPEHLAQLDRLARTYWWHVHRARTALMLARRFGTPSKGRYLDLGCGPGASTAVLAQGLLEAGLRGPEAPVGVDVDARLAEPCRRNGVDFVHGDLERGEIPGCPQGIGVFSMLDVLEHLREPENVLLALRPNLAPGALGLVTVPAYPGLYSAWDERLGHLRRYTRPELAELFNGAGYVTLWTSHLFSFALPPAWVSRRLLGGGGAGAEFPEVPGWLDGALKCLGALERAWLGVLPAPFGTSIAAVVRVTG